jgi:hypothetical protein
MVYYLGSMDIKSAVSMALDLVFEKESKMVGMMDDLKVAM